ncbi:MAG: VOC family protein [Chloroflexi bacterium]|nr:VOC family protein [Chloroflexota bacterium]
MSTYRFSHIGLCVTDLMRSREFYEKYLGFKVKHEIRPGMSETQDKFLALKKVDLTALFLTKNGFTLELLYYHSPGTAPKATRPINQPGLTHISMRVRNLAKQLDRLEKSGYTVLRERSYHTNACFIQDPDGQQIELLGIPPKAPKQGKRR